MLHPPFQLVEPVLTEEWFAFKNHQRYAIVAAFPLRILVCCNHSIKALCFGFYQLVQFNQIKASARNCLRQVISLIPAGYRSAPNQAANLFYKSKALALFSCSHAQPGQPMKVVSPVVV